MKTPEEKAAEIMARWNARMAARMATLKDDLIALALREAERKVRWMGIPSQPVEQQLARQEIAVDCLPWRLLGARALSAVTGDASVGDNDAISALRDLEALLRLPGFEAKITNRHKLLLFLAHEMDEQQQLGTHRTAGGARTPYYEALYSLMYVLMRTNWNEDDAPVAAAGSSSGGQPGSSSGGQEQGSSAAAAAGSSSGGGLEDGPAETEAGGSDGDTGSRGADSEAGT